MVSFKKGNKTVLFKNIICCIIFILFIILGIRIFKNFMGVGCWHLRQQFRDF
jgi:hypothetical protein